MTTDPKQSDDSSPARKPRWTSSSAAPQEASRSKPSTGGTARIGASVSVCSTPSGARIDHCELHSGDRHRYPYRLFSSVHSLRPVWNVYRGGRARCGECHPSDDRHPLPGGAFGTRTGSGLFWHPYAYGLSPVADMQGHSRPRSPTASEVIIAVGRGVVNQMSIGMIVVADEWTSDMSHRTITRIGELLDVSVVSFPASPTTSVELLDAPEEFQPDLAGPVAARQAVRGCLLTGRYGQSGCGRRDGTSARSTWSRRAVTVRAP